MRKFFLIFFVAILLAGIFTVVQPAEAAPWQLVPACADKAVKPGGCDVCDAIEVGINITKIMLGTLGSAALLMFVYGGVLMAISRGHTDQVTKGKDALSNAVKGVIIVLASWVVINYGLAMMLGKTDDLKNVSLFNQNWATVDCKSQASSSCKKVGEPCGDGMNCDGAMKCVETCTKHFSSEYSCKAGGTDCHTEWCPGQADSIQCCK